MPSLTFLGTGCGIPQPELGHASVLLRLGETNLLLDAGEPCAARLEVAGVPCRNLHSVYVARTRANHIAGLPMVVRCNAAQGRSEPLEVFLPEAVIDPLRAWLRALSMDDSDLPFELRLAALKSGKTIPHEGFRVAPHAMSHPGKGGGYTFLIDDGGRKIGYSSDVGDVRDIGPLLENELDVLACELAHVTPEALLEALAGKRIGVLALMHLAPTLHGDIGDLQDRFEAVLPDVDEIFIPGDGERIDF